MTNQISHPFRGDAAYRGSDVYRSDVRDPHPDYRNDMSGAGYSASYRNDGTRDGRDDHRPIGTSGGRADTFRGQRDAYKDTYRDAYDAPTYRDDRGEYHRRGDGHGADGYRSEGHRRPDDHRSDGYRTDGYRSDGYHAHGYRPDSYRADGYRDERGRDARDERNGRSGAIDHSGYPRAEFGRSTDNYRVDTAYRSVPEHGSALSYGRTEYDRRTTGTRSGYSGRVNPQDL